MSCNQRSARVIYTSRYVDNGEYKLSLDGVDETHWKSFEVVGRSHVELVKPCKIVSTRTQVNKAAISFILSTSLTIANANAVFMVRGTVQVPLGACLDLHLTSWSLPRGTCLGSLYREKRKRVEATSTSWIKRNRLDGRSTRMSDKSILWLSDSTPFCKILLQLSTHVLVVHARAPTTSPAANGKGRCLTLCFRRVV